ncbi:MAG: hypothetical protein MZU97_02880 [Bacillus subtilis]|nr:hypothetical protein [Bacillus subtilis]
MEKLSNFILSMKDQEHWNVQTIPGISVKFQTGSGIWSTRMGTDTTAEANKTYLGYGSLGVQIHHHWLQEPNRYRIVFRLRGVPGIPSPACADPLPMMCPQIGGRTVMDSG